MKRSAILLLALGACTSTGTDTLPDSTLSFNPATTQLERFAAQCGVDNPPFQDADLYSLSLIGAATDTEHPNVIEVSFHRTLPLGVDLPVDLQPFGVTGTSIDENGHQTTFLGENGTLPLDDNSFSWSQGTQADELDAGAITSATVRFDRFPTGDGDTGTVQIRLVFDDGGVFDVEAGANLTTPPAGCPAG